MSGDEVEGVRNRLECEVCAQYVLILILKNIKVLFCSVLSYFITCRKPVYFQSQCTRLERRLFAKAHSNSRKRRRQISTAPLSTPHGRQSSRPRPQTPSRILPPSYRTVIVSRVQGGVVASRSRTGGTGGTGGKRGESAKGEESGEWKLVRPCVPHYPILCL